MESRTDVGGGRQAVPVVSHPWHGKASQVCSKALSVSLDDQAGYRIDMYCKVYYDLPCDRSL